LRLWERKGGSDGTRHLYERKKQNEFGRRARPKVNSGIRNERRKKSEERNDNLAVRGISEVGLAKSPVLKDQKEEGIMVWRSGPGGGGT